MDTNELIEALRFDGRHVPEEAIEAAALQKAEMIPLFVAAIEDFCGIANPTRAAVLDSPVFVMALLLGEWRASAAYRPFCRLMSRKAGVTELLFGDAVSHCAAIMARLFDGDPEPIFTVALEPLADDVVRSGAFEALTHLAVEGRADRAAVEDFVRRAHAELRPRRDNLVWWGWTQAVAALALHDMADLARQAIGAGRVPPEVTSVKDFDADVAHAEAHPGSPWPEGLGLRELDPASVILRDYTGEDGYDDGAPGAVEPPAVNPFRDVGRNDPCPCGSGRKFKKCCLGKTAA